MKTEDFQDWTIIAGDDVRRQAKRDLFKKIQPNLYDAVLLVSKTADRPPAVELRGSIQCYGCGEELPFTRDVILHGAGGFTLDCQHCESRIEVCHWRTKKLDGSLAVFAHRMKNTNWITITPYAWSEGSPLRTLNIQISQVGDTNRQILGQDKQDI